METQNEAKCLSKMALGFSCGVLGGLVMLFTGLTATYTPIMDGAIQAFNSYYPAFKPNLFNTLVGAFWGAVYFFVFGFALAFLYNAYCYWCKSPYNKHD